VSDSHAEKHETLPTLIGIYVALIVLLIVTVWIATYNMGWVNLFVAMFIAVIKALLVILFFMHVRISRPVVWIFCGAAFIWLGIMLVLTMTDYTTRHLEAPGVSRSMVEAPAPFQVTDRKIP